MVHQIIISDDNNQLTPANLDSIKDFFPKFNHVIWDYKKIKNLILKNNDTYVLEAIDSIVPYAFKADIARYYILYNFGGWYSDLNNFFVSEPPQKNNELIFFRDVQELTDTSWSVACGLFYSNIEHKILKDAVSQCVQNVSEKYYGGHALCPTGPNLFGSVIAKNNLPEKNTYLIGSMRKQKKPAGFYIDGKLFAKYKSNNLSPGDSGIFGGNNYSKIWLERKLYS